MKRAVVVLLACLLVIGSILGTYVWSRLARIDDSGHTQHRVARLFVTTSVTVPLAAFKVNVGRFPSTEEGLSALIVCPRRLEDKWRGPYISARALEFPLDPWQRPYQYRSPGSRNPASYDLWSLGPDGVESADDVGNWE